MKCFNCDFELKLRSTAKGFSAICYCEDAENYYVFYEFNLDESIVAIALNMSGYLYFDWIIGDGIQIEISSYEPIEITIDYDLPASKENWKYVKNMCEKHMKMKAFI